MNYEYAVDKNTYEDFASGRVLYNQKGATSFPARLISEIFLRCSKLLQRQGIQAPYSVYDPLCGGAYGLTILGFLHNDMISSITASDIDDNVLKLAARNLSLLSEEGIEERIRQIQKNIGIYDKDSHWEALLSAENLNEIVQSMKNKIQTGYYQADILKPDICPGDVKYDLVIMDIPYGELVDWVTEDGNNAVNMLLKNLLPKLNKYSIVAVSSLKKTRIENENYIRLERFNIGKRQVIFLKPKNQPII